MEIANITIIIVIGIIFNYFVIYRKNKFFGCISYILLSMIMFYYSSTLVEDAEKFISASISAIMFFGSLINIFLEFLNKK